MGGHSIFVILLIDKRSTMQGGHSDEGCYKFCGIAAEVTAKKLIGFLHPWGFC